MKRKIIQRYAATEDSLDFTQILADRIELTMDRDQARSMSRQLFALYFEDIQRVIRLGHKPLVFQDAATPYMHVFSSVTKTGEPAVFLDQHFDMWLFGVNLIASVFTFFELSRERMQSLGELLEHQLGMWSDAAIRYVPQRERMRPVLLDYPKAVPLAHVLTKAMTVFALCHECAHHALGHVHGVSKPESSQQDELDADALAYRYFLAIVDAADELQYVKLDRKMLCAPCLQFHYLDVLRRWQHKEAGLENVSRPKQHPLERERCEKLFGQHRSQWPEATMEFYLAYVSTLEDLELGLQIAGMRYGLSES